MIVNYILRIAYAILGAISITRISVTTQFKERQAAAVLTIVSYGSPNFWWGEFRDSKYTCSSVFYSSSL